MGYDTTFFGTFRLTPALSPQHKSELDQLAEDEHFGAEDGTPTRERRSGRPCIYCQWRPTDDGERIAWDGGEKFYGWLEWLEYLVNNRLKPLGYTMNGEVRWQGEDPQDAGVIHVRENQIEAVPD